MTPEHDTHENPGERSQLEDILRTVRSIDDNVEEILDTLHDHFESEAYEPHWDCNDYFNGNGA